MFKVHLLFRRRVKILTSSKHLNLRIQVKFPEEFLKEIRIECGTFKLVDVKKWNGEYKSQLKCLREKANKQKTEQLG